MLASLNVLHEEGGQIVQAAPRNAGHAVKFPVGWEHALELMREAVSCFAGFADSDHGIANDNNALLLGIARRLDVLGFYDVVVIGNVLAHVAANAVVAEFADQVAHSPQLALTLNGRECPQTCRIAVEVVEALDAIAQGQYKASRGCWNRRVLRPRKHRKETLGLHKVLQHAIGF